MVKLDEKATLEQAERAVRDAFRGTPLTDWVRCEGPEASTPQGPDLVLKVNSPTGSRLLIIEVKPRGEPRLAREAAGQLVERCSQYNNAYGVFLAPYISDSAARVCAERGVGYIDLSGNCQLSFGGVFIERQGRPNKFSLKRDLGTLYSPKASRILRVLLGEPKRLWKMTEVVEAADVSLGLVAAVKKGLGDREWLREARAGFALARPAELLAEWADNYSFRKSEATDFYTMKSASETEAKLAVACADMKVRYALTAFSAAARLAPNVRYQRVFAYADDVKVVANTLGLKKVSSGANVTLLQPYDVGVYLGFCDIDEVRVVSPIQTYLDLVGLKGRGEEAATAILEEVIKPQW